VARGLVATFLYGKETTVPTAARRSGTLLVGRVLLGAIFLMAGVAKLMDWAGTAAYMESQGLPMVDVLLPIAAAVEIVGALSILTGTFARAGALALFAFLIPTTLVFHDFWTLEGAERQAQMIDFLKNLSIMGGLLLLIGAGAGKVSVDNRIKRSI
jgi:putative oxidoreductase